MEALKVKSSAFNEGGWIPVRHSGRGEDLSPPLELENIAPGAGSVAVIMDDASHPFFPNYNHWVLWNLPVQTAIPEAVPHGRTVEALGGAMQGLGYGRHRYKGPKPPLKVIHTYVFTVYVLDSRLNLPAGSRKRDLLAAMEGHVLQQTSLSGQFQSRRE